mmetsp:Transcript_15123/g.17125  ORF Transcript_15123/g.17125 Transcript_15123/m.17125 type:complete len:96 (+) Transcript_15123:279-566(+)
MGRRKRAQKQVKTQKKATVAKIFKCPFCTHDDAVECKMNRSRGLGSLTCRICGAKYQTTITYLSEPIDVFCEWIDECDAVEDGGGEAATGARYED